MWYSFKCFTFNFFFPKFNGIGNITTPDPKMRSHKHTKAAVLINDRDMDHQKGDPKL